MSRYIDADRLEECMRIVQKANKDSVEFNKRCRATDVLLDIYGMIKEQPTADVVEVVHGEWTDTTHGLICSACKTYQVYGSRFYNFCPVCGADMRGGYNECE